MRMKPELPIKTCHQKDLCIEQGEDLESVHNIKNTLGSQSVEKSSSAGETIAP